VTALSAFKPYGGSDLERFYMAAGSESGVVSLYDVSGIGSSTGGLRRSQLSNATSPASISANPVRALLNLTTKITSMAAHPSGEILAYASDEVSFMSR
jgi:hypothetical protein